MKLLPFVAFAVATAPAYAEEKRQMDAHEHGVGQLNIAIEASQIAMELHAPGADIVGFEYVAESEKDRAMVETALATLSNPLDLFQFPAGAGCSVVEASSELESEEHAHDDEHGEHDDHDEDHAHDDHDEEHAHEDEHDHEEHAAGHTEFHAEYVLNCTDLGAASEITFEYFNQFTNAKEVDVQIISDQGATAVEVKRDAPKLSLKDLF
ncbi:hypothetical protein BFP76_10385 [Amylibacter kogurei]|uniref:Zinc-binding protein n=2 Tax=Paramylibacter kogurei TaxID=1889778 RepID=A0A2G5KBG7_9RHOB|nr:DUF2796 domain-containing protein [Amylibacter kogurei]PIB26871.1 hypothetical protein BFP76_10385 [Amylibacter kogurei]